MLPSQAGAHAQHALNSSVFKPLVSGFPLSTRPSVSLVIAATADVALCRAALSVLLPVCREWDVEVLVVRPAAVADAMPAGVTVIPAAVDVPPEGYPSLGLTAARGDMVLLTTDIEAPHLDWNGILLRRLGLVAQAEGEPSAPASGAASEVGKPVA